MITEMLEKIDSAKNLFVKPQMLGGSYPGTRWWLPIAVSYFKGEGLDEIGLEDNSIGPTPFGVSNILKSDEQPASISPFRNPFKLDCTGPGCKEGDAVLSRLAPSSETQIQVIEWNMMDKWKFYPLSMMSTFSIRCMLYPFTLVKTKIQIQEKASVYSGMFDCFRKILDSEGVRGLYKGFWISAFQIVSGVFYVSTYEGVRHSLYLRGIKESHIRALVAGGCASVVGQTIIVPFDVISQHMMIIGMRQSNAPGAAVYNPLEIKYEGRSKLDLTKDIASEIYKRDGLRGFYRGYLASLSTYVPNSALWWGFYQVYQEEIIKICPPGISHLLVQCVSAMLGGWTTTIITNPLDVCRARLQVQRLPSFPKTFALLWHEEGARIFTKGLSARMFQSGVFSMFIILGYESIKRLSVSEGYQDRVRW